MLRSIGIALIISQMVADPYLCASAAADTDCRTPATSAPCEHHRDAPASHGCHSCLCRGATMSRDQHEVVCVACLPAAVQPLRVPTAIVVDYYTRVQQTHPGHPHIGRHLRVILESYLA